MKKAIIFTLLFLSSRLFAQETPDLITDRPDQTESAATVPHKSLQIETGFIWGNDETSTLKTSSTTYNTTLLRYGLLNNFELRLGMEYNGDKFENKQLKNTSSINGLSPLHAGFKIKITEEEGWKPEMAFLAGLDLPFTAATDYKTDYTAAGMRLSFAHTLSDRLSVGYNLGAEWDGDTAIPGYFYSLALGIGITDKIGAFTEFYGTFFENNTAEHLFDAGFTYLIKPKLQIDLSGGLGLNDNALDSFISCGLSYRLPN